MAKTRMDGRTPEQVEQELIAYRAAIIPVVAEIVKALHDADFRRLYIQSSQNGESFWQWIVIDEETVRHDDMMTLYEIADAFDARLSLEEVRMNQQSFSRLRIWPTAD